MRSTTRIAVGKKGGQIMRDTEIRWKLSISIRTLLKKNISPSLMTVHQGFSLPHSLVMNFSSQDYLASPLGLALSGVLLR